MARDEDLAKARGDGAPASLLDDRYVRGQGSRCDRPYAGRWRATHRVAKVKQGGQFRRAGLYDLSPRSREIVWIMLGARAARGLGSLYAHANDITMTEAGDIHVGWTPRGFMHRDLLLCKEQHLYLRQPGYGASYVTGARLLDEVMAQRARQLGEDFNLRRFFEELNAVGMIPVSLIYWELTGDDVMVTGGRM